MHVNLLSDILNALERNPTTILTPLFFSNILSDGVMLAAKIPGTTLNIKGKHEL